VRESAPERERREAAAIGICEGCVVRGECLEYALRVNEPLGIWGGLTEAERHDLTTLATAESAIPDPRLVRAVEVSESVQYR
jgi:WhiB family redox-sensing transcriptional regulator